ncbi:MAG: hypothetical protein JSW08_03405 [archaeon]|nr:MAG: hypothetical protein JSW08_03405 [archaeon]
MAPYAVLDGGKDSQGDPSGRPKEEREGGRKIYFKRKIRERETQEPPRRGTMVFYNGIDESLRDVDIVRPGNWYVVESDQKGQERQRRTHGLSIKIVGKGHLGYWQYELIVKKNGLIVEGHYPTEPCQIEDLARIVKRSIADYGPKEGVNIGEVVSTYEYFRPGERDLLFQLLKEEQEPNGNKRLAPV